MRQPLPNPSELCLFDFGLIRFREKPQGEGVFLSKCFLVVRSAISILALVSITLSMKATENTIAPALRLIEAKRPLVIGHRGYCQFAPENTLPSFQLAVTAGADLVELDYHHSKDGQQIVIHD